MSSILKMRKERLREVKKVAHVSWLGGNRHGSVGNQNNLLLGLSIFKLNAWCCLSSWRDVTEEKKAFSGGRWC
jgi:hypothetical protein